MISGNHKKGEKTGGWLGWSLPHPPLDLPGALKITLEIDRSTLINTWNYSIQSRHWAFSSTVFQNLLLIHIPYPSPPQFQLVSMARAPGAST